MSIVKRHFRNLPKELFECAHCHLALPKVCFYVNARYKSGYKTTCIKCDNAVRATHEAKNRGKYNAESRKWRKDHPNEIRGHNLKRHYGITLDYYNRLYISQNGKCAICEIKLPRLLVDHCHDSGIVRELLCGNCNKMIGFASEDTTILEKAIKYVNKHSHLKAEDVTTRKTG